MDVPGLKQFFISLYFLGTEIKGILKIKIYIINKNNILEVCCC